VLNPFLVSYSRLLISLHDSALYTQVKYGDAINNISFRYSNKQSVKENSDRSEEYTHKYITVILNKVFERI